MDLHDSSRVLLRSIAVVVGLPILAAVGAGLYSSQQTPMYQATTSVYVATREAVSASDLNAGGIYAQQVVKSYADLAEKPIVLNRVIGALHLDTTATRLAKSVTVEAPINTTVLDISVIDSSPRRAATIADAMSDAIRKVVPQLSPSAGEAATVKVTPVGNAAVPVSPVSPRPGLWMALAFVAGLAAAVGVAFLREALDQRIRTVRDVSLVVEQPVIGHIMRDPNAHDRPLVVVDAPRSPRAEAFRTLRTNLQFFDFGENGRSIVVTSAQESEGKSTTAANLAIAMADAGDRVALVEADLRRPKMHHYLGIERSVGLTDVLIGRATLDEALQRWGQGGVSVLPSGLLPPNPSELLQGRAMTELLAELEQRFDTIIIDAPPLLPVSDAAILARRTAGALMVTAVRRTTRNQLQSAVSRLEQVDARVLGVVMTMLPDRGAEARGYGARGYEARLESADIELADPVRPSFARLSAR